MEIQDLYDINRIKTGETTIRGNKIKKGRYRLTILICIFNSENKMLIQHRQPFKNPWPNLWDVTVGGSSIAGETSQDAAERELFEEIGLKLNFDNMRPALTINFYGSFNDVYLINNDVNTNSLTLQQEEVKEVKWASMYEIISMIDENIFIPYNKNYIELLFYLKNHTTTYLKK